MAYFPYYYMSVTAPMGLSGSQTHTFQRPSNATYTTSDFTVENVVAELSGSTDTSMFAASAIVNNVVIANDVSSQGRLNIRITNELSSTEVLTLYVKHVSGEIINNLIVSPGVDDGIFTYGGSTLVFGTALSSISSVAPIVSISEIVPFIGTLNYSSTLPISTAFVVGGSTIVDKVIAPNVHLIQGTQYDVRTTVPHVSSLNGTTANITLAYNPIPYDGTRSISEHLQLRLLGNI